MRLPIHKLGDIVTGKTPSKAYPDDWGNDIQFITPSDIKSDNKYLKETQRMLSREGANRLKSKHLPPYSVLVSCIGSDMGKVVMNTNTCITNQQINAIIVNNENDGDYVYYLLKSQYEKLRSIASGGSTMPIINKTDFENIELDIYSLQEQKSIAAILSSLDDKIELLQEQNKTLESIAQTIFKEWFVNFNFPNEKGKPYKESSGEMVDSELGMIPKGWKTPLLGDSFSIQIGRTPPRKEPEWFSTYEGDRKWISIKDLGNNGVYIYSTSEYLTQAAVENFNIPIIPPNTTIISFKMTVGRLAITTEEMLSNEAIAHLVVNSKTPVSSEYIYLCLQNLNFDSLGSTSSIVTAINSTMIKKLKYICPTKTLMDAFEEIEKPIFSKINSNTLQIKNLIESRDLLLPRLLNGDVSVDEI